ncbi:MAG TPA: GNAT family protein [Thermomicrobiales bacterium]|jgi:RimJ/RimL family protein N-acetyltransferase
MPSTDPVGPPVVAIVGDRLALGPLRRDLIPVYGRWTNDFAVTRTLRSSQPTTIEQVTASYDQLGGDERSVNFTIYLRDGWRPIGNTALVDLDWRARTAEFILFIGEADCRGQGYGTEATRLMLDYAFTALGLHSVMLKVYDFNLAGRRVYEKAGFRTIGRRRECQLMGGTLWDVEYMDCLAREFVSPTLHTIFTPDEPRASGPVSTD